MVTARGKPRDRTRDDSWQVGGKEGASDSGGMRQQRRDELLAVAEALERLAIDIREKVAGDEDAEEAPPPAVPSEPEAAGAVGEGQRVRVMIRDRYYGRLGTIIDARGVQFWNIRLDAMDGGVSVVIYKKASSFRIINDR